MPLAHADLFIRYVDCESGSDVIGDGSAGSPWKTLGKATSAHGLTLNPGDGYTIRVRPSITAVSDSLQIGPGLAAGTHMVVEPDDGHTAIRLRSDTCATIGPQWLSGSLTLRHVAWTGGTGQAVTVFDASGRSVDITLENCSLSPSPANHVIWLGNVGNSGGIVLSDCTITDCQTVVSGGLCGRIVFEDCTIRDCERLISIGGPVGPIAMSRNVITAGVDDVVPAPLIAAQVMSDLILEDNVITATSMFGGTASLYNNSPLLRGDSEFRLVRNTISLSGPNMTGHILKIPDIAAGGRLNLAIENNVIRSGGGSPAVVVGLQPVAGQTRAQSYVMSSKLWRNVSIARNSIINTCHSGGALWVLVGPNGSSITDNFLKGGVNAHTFEIAADDCTVSGNVSTGHLPLLIFGDRCLAYNNTALATSDNGCLLGRPGGTDWEVSIGGSIHHNLFCTLGSQSNDAALNDYVYNKAPYGPLRPMDHRIDYNCYWAPNTNLLNLNGLACPSLAEARNVWATGTLNGQGQTPWNSAHPDNDSHSISEDPLFSQPASEYRAGFVPRSTVLWAPDGNYFGAMMPDENSPRADFDGDGRVDVVDLLILIDAWGTLSTKTWDPTCDLNEDGAVDDADLQILMGNWGDAAFAGDTNSDSLIDVADLLYLLDAFGSTVGDARYNGLCDFDDDGVVDVVDLLVLVENWGRLLPGDINGDGHVDDADLLVFLKAFGTLSSKAWNPACDLNDDGSVDVADLLALLDDWGR